MSQSELLKKVQEYTELKRMAAELADELATIENALKAELAAQSADELNVQGYKISYKPYETSRFDTTSFKKEHAVMFAQYAKTTTVARFSVRG